MSEPSVDFGSLLKRAREGDRGAVENIIRRYEPEIQIVAHVRLGPALRPFVDTIDLVQSVHKSLLRGLRGGRFNIANSDQLVALALTMVRRKVARQSRRHRRQEHSDDTRNLVQQLTELSAAADPERQAELGALVKHLWQQLDDTEKSVIELRLAGYSTAQAARELGRDPDVLRVQLSRLRRRLRDEGVQAEWL